MTTKPTLRHNGRHMFTLRVAYNLDINEIIDRITVGVIGYGDDLPRSRTAALAIARRHCKEYGRVKERWDQGCDADDWAMYRRDVADRIRLIFPDLSNEITD